MATLSELVDTIADVEGIDPATIVLIARYVREAGLISTGGRGPSAARMGLTDATNLLIAVNATSTAAKAATTVSDYRELEAHEPRIEADPRPPVKYGMLGEAIEQLIHAIGVGEFPEVFLHQEVPLDLQEAFPKGDVHIEIKFRTSSLSALVRIAPVLLPREEATPHLIEKWVEKGIGGSLLFQFYPPRLRGSAGKQKKKKTGDRTEEITIGYRTVRAVGRLLQI